LEKLAFHGTKKRSPIRIVRETELLGAELFAEHTRENLILGAKFLRDDLPYFFELLAEFVQQPYIPQYIVDEDVANQMSTAHRRILGSTEQLALNSVHGVAFHRGLGTPVGPTSSTYKRYLDQYTMELFHRQVLCKPNFALVANGADHAEVSKLAGEFFSDVPASAPEGYEKLSGTAQTQYYGGEERIAHASGNTMVIGFPGSSSFTGPSYKPELAVLAKLLGGESSIKWSSGFSLLAKEKAKYGKASVSTKSHIYSDAGLLTVTISGSSDSVRGIGKGVLDALNAIAKGSVGKEEVAKAVALARFKELEHGQNIMAGLELTGAGLAHQGKPYQLDDSAKAIASVTPEKVAAAAKTLLESKASVSCVGDLYQLPWAEELGIKV
jgi:ubiquinol-cytochrome c reductase core subunit 2